MAACRSVHNCVTEQKLSRNTHLVRVVDLSDVSSCILGLVYYCVTRLLELGTGLLGAQAVLQEIGRAMQKINLYVG